MDNIMVKAIQKLVDTQFSQNTDAIEKTLFSGIDDTMTTEEICPRMVLNATKLSVNMSVQIITELLQNADVIAPVDEVHLRKMLLSLVEEN